MSLASERERWIPVQVCTQRMPRPRHLNILLLCGAPVGDANAIGGCSELRLRAPGRFILLQLGRIPLQTPADRAFSNELASM